MFDTDNDFFHFVFADQNDDYYTATYVKMKFGSYMRHVLINSGFRYIFLLGKDKYKSYWFECSDTALERLESVKPSKKVFSFFKSSGSKKIEKADDKSNWKHIDINDLEQTKYYLINIFDFMINNTDAVTVIPIDLFVKLTEHDDLVNKLIQLKKLSRHNILVITSSIKASENDKYFRNTKYEYGYEGMNQNKCSEIFYNPKLFPELVKKFNLDMTEIPKLIFLYDMIKECFKERMQVWSELSYDQILSAVKYTIMRLPPKSMKNIILPESLAAVIYTWYRSEFFREKYSCLNFPENKYRRLAEITDMVRQHLPSNVKLIEKIIEQEGTNNIQDFVKRWPCRAPSIMIDDSMQGIGNNRSTILQLLIWYKKILKAHEECLTEEEICNVYDMIYQFSKPFLQSANNKGSLPHEQFNESQNSFFFNTLFKELEQKEEWNSWDNLTAKLLYTLFKICYKEAMSMGGTQIYNDRGKNNFYKCKEKLSTYRKNSQDRLFDKETVESFANDMISFINNII